MRPWSRGGGRDRGYGPSIGKQRCVAKLEAELCHVLANDPDKDTRAMCAVVIGEAEEEWFANCVEAALPGASGVVRYALAALL